MKRTEIKTPEQVGGDNKGEIVLYQPEGEVRLEVRVENETVWLTQAQMATLFGKVPQNITIHIKNIYRERELDRTSTCKEYLQVAHEGGNEMTAFSVLDFVTPAEVIEKIQESMKER